MRELRRCRVVLNYFTSVLLLSSVTAVSCTVIVLWLFDFIVYSRFFDHPLRNFVDLCSTCNVSVIVLTQERFGYYIHGRTVHGRADVDLKQMAVCMKREQVRLFVCRLFSSLDL